MGRTFAARRVSEHVFWVGAVDWAIRDFHGYATRRGTTYNAYLITGATPTLVDTVKAPFFDEMMARIASVMNPEEIEVLISNHSEMDHSGCVPRTIEAIRPGRVYASANGVKALAAHFHGGTDIHAVENGQTISLGDRNVTFVETRMLHWPDSMVTYLDADRVLFSQDGFGMHLAGVERFADELDWGVMGFEAARYYANILLPLSPLVEKLLAAIPQLGIQIDIVAPDHGPIYRTAEDIQRIFGLYAKWAAQVPTAKVVIVYDTMWESTAKLAAAIADGVTSAGASAVVRRMRAHHRSDVATDVLDAGALAVGSPTLNNGLFPSVADVMTYLKGLKPKNLVGAAFGSYGWSGESIKQLDALLDEMKVRRVADGLRVKYVPDTAALEQAADLGRKVAEAVT